jgi:uncharacterized protein
MEIYRSPKNIALKDNWLLSLVVFVLISLGALFFMQGLGILLIPLLFQLSIDELLTVALGGEISNPQGRMAFLFLQGLGSAGGFILAGWLIAKVVEKADFQWKFQANQITIIGFAWVILILFSGVLFNAILIDFNANFQFPEALKSLETIFKAKEDELMRLTKFLTDFANVQEFLFGLFVIGVLAGVAEEFLFRGILQPKLKLYLGNPHVAIWLTAAIFSAIHLQFYGFLPRMMLGAIFGYMYHYSGSLFYPMIGHVLNNGITVVLVYMNKMGKLDFDIEQTEQIPLTLGIFGLIVMIFSLRTFRYLHKKKSHE